MHRTYTFVPTAALASLDNRASPPVARAPDLLLGRHQPSRLVQMPRSTIWMDTICGRPSASVPAMSRITGMTRASAPRGFAPLVSKLRRSRPEVSPAPGLRLRTRQRLNFALPWQARSQDPRRGQEAPGPAQRPSGDHETVESFVCHPMTPATRHMVLHAGIILRALTNQSDFRASSGSIFARPPRRPVR